jgi:5-methyltetrahydropteroyltriglutamate--homocysteine methyltransferase
VGSLPRPDDLIEIMFAREDGIPIDRAALATRVESAVDEAVARQVGAGIDIINDGEWPKPSYATYI